MDFENNSRAPLLLISGGQDYVSPASVVAVNFGLYQESSAVTVHKEFSERTHYTLGQENWEEMADFALQWSEASASMHLETHAK